MASHHGHEAGASHGWVVVIAAEVVVIVGLMLFVTADAQTGGPFAEDFGAVQGVIVREMVPTIEEPRMAVEDRWGMTISGVTIA